MRPRRVIAGAGLTIALIVTAGCVFAPNFGDGQVRCGSNGECPPGQTCADDNFCHQVTPSASGNCVPRNCYVGWCGPISDGCGKTIDCGPCNPTAPAVDAGVRDMAGCVPTAQCIATKTCGTLDDGCGRALHCPDCAVTRTCSNTKPNDCTCTPKTCADVGATCGHYPDGCGTILNCFPDMGTSCAPMTGFCGGGGAYKCGKTAGCMPLSDCPPGACGAIPDGCRGVLRCGNACPAGQLCGGGGHPNVCG
jgi:hypothetical protein